MLRSQSKAFLKWTETRRQLALQLLMGLLIASFSGTLGYFMGTSSRSARSWKGLLGACAARNLAGGQEQRDFDERDGVGGSDAVYTAILENGRLDEKNRKLTSVFSHSDIGRALTHLTTLSDFIPGEDSPEGTLLAEDMKLLESQPRETLHNIRRSMRKLGDEFSSERQLLVQLIGKLDLEISEKTDFLSDELNREEKVAALSTLMQLEVDPTSIETALRQSISGKLSYSSRLLLLNIFESRYPEQARKIKNDFGI